MATLDHLVCDVDSRRRALLDAQAGGTQITGIDYIVVNADQRSLEVFFIGMEPPAELNDRQYSEVLGGRRVNDVRVTGTSITGGATSSLHLDLSSPGDFSDYVLEITEPPGAATKLDELYRRCEFNFKVDCPARFDCKPTEVEIEPAPEGIDIDYMAKDYASFRQALVDLIPRLSPRWTERLAADLGMTVLELLAYAADQLSYYQDAVANEAYLETARQRISVRRHARLVDYHMHDGASARAFVHFALTPGPSMTVNPGQHLELLTRILAPIGAGAPAEVIAEEDRERAMALTGAVFETFTYGTLDPDLNEMALYAWSQGDCAAPKGATTVDLVGSFGASLARGHLLLLEEVKDPKTGDENLANPAHRQVVRLTDVEELVDNLATEAVTRVTWAEADALTFPLCIASPQHSGISVARGNLLLADHGKRIEEPRRNTQGEIVGPGGRADLIASGSRAPRFKLEQGPLSFRPALTDTEGPVVLLGTVDPRGADPQVTATGGGQDWTPVSTLIGSDRFDPHFAVETDNDGRALLRFGDDVFGMQPDLDTKFDVTYRVGIGPEGNVGSEAIAHVMAHEAFPGLADRISEIRNPLPAWGGVEPESATAVKRIAPAAFRAIQYRAVTEADYAEVAERHPLVRSAVARFRWTGSWHTVFISIDPEGRLGLDAGNAALIADHVAGFTQAGYDLEIVEPNYVPLAIDLQICVARAHFRPDVAQAVRSALSSGLQPNGLPGFFHPDRFTFGQPLYLSALYAAIVAVEGVESVAAIRFARLSDGDPDTGGPFTAVNLDRGDIPLGPLEIVRLDDDPDFPENGLLRLIMQGGK